MQISRFVKFLSDRDIRPSLRLDNPRLEELSKYVRISNWGMLRPLQVLSHNVFNWFDSTTKLFHVADWSSFPWEAHPELSTRAAGTWRALTALYRRKWTFLYLRYICKIRIFSVWCLFLSTPCSKKVYLYHQTHGDTPLRFPDPIEFGLPSCKY